MQESILFSKFCFSNLSAEIFNSVSDMVAILDGDRKIVFANKKFYKLIGASKLEDIIGLSPGEALQCSVAVKTKYKCGDSKDCQVCRAFNAMIKAQNNLKINEECRILQQNATALDLLISTAPYKLNNSEDFIIFIAVDVSHEKRRKVLEKIFFHDVLNLAGGIKSILDILENSDQMKVDVEDLRSIMNDLSNNLIEEINSYRELTMAENYELVVNYTEVNSLSLLKEILSLYVNHEVAKDKHLIIQQDSCEVSILIDKTLLRRVISNMIKNALEASDFEKTVIIGCFSKNKKICFWVQNDKFIPEEVQLQVFQRSFSTKGTGRGLGTYSMKLLSKRYLNGDVSFESSEDNGTIFKASYPISN